VFGFMLQQGFEHAEQVGNFRRQQITVLITDLLWRAFEVHIDPARRARNGYCPGIADLLLSASVSGAEYGLGEKQ